jgi:hypothetical protein
MTITSRDALTLKYDKPVNRIAARLFWRVPDFNKLPEIARMDLITEPPRIKPQDLTYIFAGPPILENGGHPQDHRGERCGIYLVLGYAGSLDSVRRKNIALLGKRPLRTGFLKGGPVHHPNQRYLKKRINKKIWTHYWWVRAPDGSVVSRAWKDLRQLHAGETISASRNRKRAEKTQTGSK